MKRFLLSFSMLLTSIIGMAQGMETFTNLAGASTNPAYQNRTWTGDNGIVWTATDARIDNVTITGQAVGIRAGKVSATGIPNGIGDLSFKYKYLFTGVEAVLHVKINGNVVGTVNVPSTATAAQTAVFNGINVGGIFSIDIEESITTIPPGATSIPRVAIDDVTWTGYEAATCTTPGSQASNLGFTTITPTSISGGFNNFQPDIDGFIVVRSTSSTLTQNPVNGTSYSEGDSLGNGVVVSFGNMESFTATDLAPNTRYYFFVFAMNNVCSNGPFYLTSTPALTGNTTTQPLPPCTTPTSAPGAISFTPSNTSISGSFNPATGANGYLVIVNTTGSLNFTPQNGAAYTAGQVVGSGNTGTVVSFAQTTTFSSSNLTPGTTYYYYIFASGSFNCTGGPLYFTTSANGQTNTTTTPATGEPAGYYSTATNKSCADLKTALKQITTNGMQPKTYGQLWSQYSISDVKPREVGTGSANVIWDVYSDVPNGTDPYNFTPGSDQCGNYSGEGDCYNREHTFPQSWFTTGTSVGPGTDYHQVYPTDGKVNAERGNLVFGEVATATYTSRNGSKKGSSAFAGVNGTVFEPIDEYKGDLARAFLYMVTRYEDDMPNWGDLNSNSAPALAPNTYPSVDIPYLRMMIKWHIEDPVSAKEIARNNAGYNFQRNRNPFVDHPEYVDMVWNSTCPGMATLPVSITWFKGSFVAGKVQLNWLAENELNFDRFEVERSVNGTSYQKIGAVRATALRNYGFTDPVDAFGGQRIYYRLKKVDKDGKFQYSEVFSLHIPRNTRFSVYPNPATSFIKVQLSSNVNGKVTLLVTDISGKVMKQQVVNASGNTINIATTGLTSGLYLVKLVYGGEQFVQKVMVHK